MAIPAIPDHFVRTNSVILDDESTFTSAETGTFTAAQGGKWSFGTLSIHQLQLDSVATKIEQLFLQDFAQPTENSAAEIDSIIDVTGEIAGVVGATLNMSITVRLQQTGDAPSGFEIAGSSVRVWSPGVAWAFVKFVRETLAIGEYYTPS